LVAQRGLLHACLDREVAKVADVGFAAEARLDEAELVQELVLPVRRVIDTVDGVPLIDAVVRHGDHHLAAILHTPNGVEGRNEGPVGVLVLHHGPVFLALDGDADIRTRHEANQGDLPRVLRAGDERTDGLARRVLDDLTLAEVHATHGDILLITCFSDNR
jgi:hypothetical protein